jgi:sigma-B regulation protein RsbU (phosphoserine phosphatase)
LAYHASHAAPKERPPAMNAEPVTVLVVDDTTPIRNLLRRILEEDYAVHTAPDGETALSAFARNRPEIVILDVNMPGLSGLEVVSELRRRGEDEAVVIMLTASDDQALKAEALNLGANDFLTKPFHKGELLARVGAAARQVLLMRELRAAHERTALELSRIAALQRRMLPETPPRLPGGLSSEVLHRASALASGDYFDCVPLGEDRVRCIVADVSGHGARAAFLMAVVRTLFHAAWADGLALDVLAGRINRHLLDLRGDGDFATLFAADLDCANRLLTYVNCGHPPALLAREGEEPLLLEATMPLLGVMDCNASLGHAELTERFGLFAFTDGLFEWRDESGGVFGLPRFLDLVGERLTFSGPFLAPLAESLDALSKGDTAERDDLTALWLSRSPHA